MSNLPPIQLNAKAKTLVVAVMVMIVLAVVFWATSASAGTAIVTYTPATDCEDRTPFPAGAKGPENAEFGTCSTGTSFGTVLGSVTAPNSSSSSITIDSPLLTENGTFCFRAFTNLVTDACGIGKRKSAASNVASKLIPIKDHGGPGAPVLVTVTTTAWVLRERWWGTRLRVVKDIEITLGTQCGAQVYGENRKQNAKPYKGFFYVGNDGLIGKCARVPS